VSALNKRLMRVGPTHGAALLRIGLTLVLWHEMAAPMRYQHDLNNGPAIAASSVFWVSSTTLFLGLYARASALITGLACAIWYVASDGPERLFGLWEDPVVLLLAVGLATAAPLGATLSVDAWRRGSQHAPLWGLDLVAGLWIIADLLMALEHSDVPSLSGTRMGQRVVHYYGSTWLEHPLGEIALQSAAIGSAAVLWSAPALLVWRRTRTRTLGIVVVAGWHLLHALVFPAGTVHVLMCVLLICFVDQERLASQWQRLVPQRSSTPAPPGP